MLTFTGVILRNIFHTSIPYSQELSRQIILWLTFFGAALATLNNRHLALNVLSNLLPNKAQKIHRIMLHSISFLIIGWLFVISLHFIRFEKEGGAISLFGVKAWLVELVIPIGFLLLLISFLVAFFSEVGKEDGGGNGN